MAQRFEPEQGASGMVAHLHQFTLRGHPASVAFPPLCAECGAPAASRLTYSKVFRRTHTDAPTENIITTVAVPFCERCTARHHEQVSPPTQWAKVLSSFATGEMLGAVFPGIAALFVTYLGLKELLHGRFMLFGIFCLLAAFFGLIAWSQRRHVWAATEHLRVAPPSDITKAFDFSDDIANAFEPPRFMCSIKNEDFAIAFESLNRDLEWRADSPAAKADARVAYRTTWIIGGIVVALALAGMIADWFG